MMFINIIINIISIIIIIIIIIMLSIIIIMIMGAEMCWRTGCVNMKDMIVDSVWGR